MGKAFLRAKAKIRLENEPYVIERLCGDGIWVLRHESTDRALERTREQLFDDYVSGKLVFGAGPVTSFTKPNQPRQAVPQLPEGTEGDAAKERLLYVKAVVGLPHSQKRIEDAIEEVYLGLNPRPHKKPSWISVYRWTRTYLSSGQNPRALLAAHGDKGNRQSRYGQEVTAICEAVIDRVYLTLERPSLQHCVDLAKGETRAANKLRPNSQQLPLPSRALLQRLVKRIPAYDRHVARYGWDAARNRFRVVLRKQITDAPLQRGQIDHTRMDVLAVDDTTGVPLGRPWLTLLIDDFTRCVLGYCLSYEPPSRATVARCLRVAFMPKPKLKERFPDLKNDWDAFGVVSELVMDNGLEFHSTELERIFFDLGIEAHYAPRKTGWAKEKIERLQGTLNRRVTSTLPGKTFSNIFEKDDYDPMKHAIVSERELEHVIVRWIVDEYHQKPHSGLDGQSPAKAWAINIRVHDIPVIDDPMQFDAIVGGSEVRKLTHKGIQCFGLQYNSVDMADLRRLLGEKVDVEVRFNRSNLGSIVVIHPERKTLHRVPCLNPEYAEGLTEWQHDVCKRYARERNKGNDPDGWLDAFREICEIVSRQLGVGRSKGRGGNRVGRWTEGKATASAPPLDSERSLPPARPDEGVTRQVIDALVTSPTPLVLPPVTRKRFQPILSERQPMRGEPRVHSAADNESDQADGAAR